MKPLGIRDLLALVFLIALHFATCKLAVDYRHHWIFRFLILTPIALTALLQIRFQLSLQFATIVHYPLCLAWAFLSGATYSMYWNRVPHDFFERDSVGLGSPLRYGVFCMEVGAFLGFASTTLYCIGGWLVTRSVRGRLNRLSLNETGDEP